MLPIPPNDELLEMTLEEALNVIQFSGVHFNFGNNIEARKRHYARQHQAVRIAQAAGYIVTTDPNHSGYILKVH